MLFLLRVMSGKAQLSKKKVEAVDKFLLILNMDWGQPQLQHACRPDCACNGRKRMRQDLLAAVKTLLFLHPRIPSTSRWTSMSPALAYFALWLWCHQLGPVSYTHLTQPTILLVSTCVVGLASSPA